MKIQTDFEKTHGIKPRLLNIHNACMYSGDSRAKLYAEAKAGNIRFVKMDGSTRVELAELDRYINAKAKPANLAA